MTRLNEVGSGNSFSRMRKFTRNKSSVLKNYKRATYQKRKEKRTINRARPLKTLEVYLSLKTVE